MQIAVISDIHDHIGQLAQALKRVQTAQGLICCGDLCSPFIMEQLGKGFKRPVHVVWGNNDGDRYRLTQTAADYSQITVHGEYAELTLDKKRFAVNHFDGIGRALAASSRFDVVCYGHNHQHELTRKGHTQVINPGEVMGELTGTSTLALYDSENHQAQLVTLS